MSPELFTGFALGWTCALVAVAAGVLLTRTRPDAKPAPVPEPPVTPKPMTTMITPETVDKATRQIMDEVRARGGTITPEAAREHALEMLAIL